MVSTPRPPRVLYCTDTYPPQLNGVSVVTALSVAGLQRRGWQVGVVAPAYPAPIVNPFASDPGDGPDDLTVLPSCRLPLYPDLRLSMATHAAIDAAVHRFAPDLIHCATEFVIGRMGQRVAHERGIPVVSSYHTDFSRYTAAYGVPWLREPVRQYLRRFHAGSLRVYTPGVAACDELRALGIAAPQLWGRGVNVDLFHPARRDRSLRQAYGGDHALLFLHVGRLAAEKGVERILEAFHGAQARLPAGQTIRLVVAGSGPRERTLKAMGSTSVTFLGNLDRVTMLPQLYASADAFLFASHTETLGLVILEAMASGLPVIAAPAGGVADHLVNGVNGLTYAPGNVPAMADAILTLATSAALRNDLAAGARRTAEALSWEHELDRLHTSYREVLDRRDSPATVADQAA